MVSYFGYFLLGAGIATFVFVYFNKSVRPIPLIFVATMMVLAGLVILQFVGSPSPGLS